MELIWKEINGSNGIYLVSNQGDIKSLKFIGNDKRGRPRKGEYILGQYISKWGYYQVNIKLNGRTRYNVHRLVAETFIPNPHNLPQVNHKDGNKLNNEVENLEWVTVSDNQKHSYQVLGRSRFNPTEGKFGKDHHLSIGIDLYEDNIIVKSFDSSVQAAEYLRVTPATISNYLNNITKNKKFDLRKRI